MKIYFVRHGQTDANAGNIAMGQGLNVPLNETGLKQAETLAESLDKDFNKIYCSPLIRAQQTCEVISKKLGLPFETRHDLAERDAGTLSGRSWDEIKKLTGEGAEVFADEIDTKKFHGESLGNMENRLINFIEEIKSQHTGQKVLAVSHAGVIREMHSLYRALNDAPIENATVHIFEV